MRRDFCAAVAALLVISIQATLAGPLDDYVNKHDPNYAWSDTGLGFSGPGWTGHILNMTSQAWLTPADWQSVNGPPGNLWWHYMLVVVPDKIAFTDAAFMYITGGDNKPSSLPTKDSEPARIAADFAVNTGLISTVLYKVPSEPIFFHEEKPVPQRRTEDEIIAWTWKHYIEDQSDPEWIVRLPMTKAAVRGMDTVAAYAKAKLRYNVQKFVIAGASKRGWTTWTTAAVDKRVVAAIPIVMDELNVVENLHHHYRAYGGWSWVLNDYWQANITRMLDSPETKKLMEIEDPLSYSARLTMPKLVVCAVNDEFFLPDDTRYWWDDMADEKRLLMVPNAGHSLSTGIIDHLPSIEGFAYAVLTNQRRPSVRWEINDDAGVITVHTDPATRPLNVTMWYGFSAPGTGRRDWRRTAGYPEQYRQDVPFFDVQLREEPQGNKWVAVAPRPPQGRWTAFFVNVQYELPYPPTAPLFFEFTSEVSITPNTFPFPDCHGEGCYGKLV